MFSVFLLNHKMIGALIFENLAFFLLIIDFIIVAFAHMQMNRNIIGASFYNTYKRLDHILIVPIQLRLTPKDLKESSEKFKMSQQDLSGGPLCPSFGVIEIQRNKCSK